MYVMPSMDYHIIASTVLHIEAIKAVKSLKDLLNPFIIVFLLIVFGVGFFLHTSSSM